ncbi:MAG: hypothetical protein ACXWEF_05195 [Solirubrobacterales bacterium]
MSSDEDRQEPIGDEPAREPESEAEGPGVLGNLPRSRPSVRSPRRATASAQPGTPAAAKPAADGGPGTEAAEDRAAAEEAARTITSGSTGDPETPAPGGGPEADLERLARAGLSVAGGAATLGLRAAGRAAAALRDAVERR